MSHDHWQYEEERQTTDDEAKKHRFWTLRPRNISDDEFVENIRKSEANLKRWKWAFVLFHAGMMSVLVGFIPQIVEFTADLLGNQFPVQPGGMPAIAREVVLIGLGLGFTIGFQFTHSIHQLVLLLSHNRTAELLLKYHDIVQQHEHTEQPT